MRKIVERYKRWRKWKKRYGGSFIYNLLVLFKLIDELTFDWIPTAEEEKDIKNTIIKNEEKI